MRKGVAVILVFIMITALFFTLIPNVLSQPENVKILSYSWYPVQLVSGTEFIFVVGEVQNVGPNIIEQIYLGGIIYTKDGEGRALSYTVAYSDHILPQQKAPFEMYYYSQDSYSGVFSWYPIGIDHIDFGVVEANQTDYYQYPDLEVINAAGHVIEGVYTVEGTIRNNGNQSAGRLRIVATFYNASGDVIAAGVTNYLTPNYLPPGLQTTSFAVTPLDYTNEVETQINSYALVVQTEGPIIPEFPPFLILPLFVTATLLAVIVYRKRLLKSTSE